MTARTGPGKGRKLLFVAITALLAVAVLEGVGTLAYISTSWPIPR